ncbi:hypothetical protein ABJB81_004473 [Pseudomonas putida]
MSLRFHALLTHPDSPAEGASGRSCAEKKLVNVYIESLPPALRAQESQALMADYAIAIRATPNYTRWNISVLEKFLLWSFIVARKSLAELNNKDVLDFLNFCKNPPESWISKHVKRFIKEDGALKPNPKWRPFNAPLRSPDTRCVINRFFALCSESIGLVYCPLPRSEIPRNNTCCCSSAESWCRNYLDEFKENTKGKAGLELGLLLFATSFYLKIPLRDCADYLTWDCFDLSDRDNGRFKVNTGQGSIAGEIPEAYMEYFFRWRSISKLPAYPTTDEIRPLFHCRARNYSAAYIPKLGSSGLIPTKMLRAFLLGCARCRAHGSPWQSGFDRNKRHRSRLTNKKLDFSAINKFYQEAAGLSLCTPATPVPLYLVKNEIAAPLPIKVITYLLTSFNPAANGDICSAGASLFHSFINMGPNHLKLRAFEKLTLWSVLIAGKSPANLVGSDAESFYLYCLNPPAQWVGARIYPRSSILWRPFLKLRPGKENNVPRAGMIVNWCNACYIQLVQAGILRSNPFQRLNKYIN